MQLGTIVVRLRFENLRTAINYMSSLFCTAPVVDYDAMRKSMAAIFDEKIVEVRGLVTKLQKTQRAAEQTLEKY